MPPFLGSHYIQLFKECNTRSGKPGSTPLDQNKYGVGPIPEGKYIVDPAITDHYNWWDPRNWDWSGARTRAAWGDIRTPIEPMPGTNLPPGRTGGFLIHESSVWGSAGCIDLTVDNASFHNWLQSYGRPIDLIVDYRGWYNRNVH